MRQLKTTLTQRRAILAIAFVATLASALLAPSQENPPREAPAPAVPTQRAGKPAASMQELPALPSWQRAIGQKVVVVDVFEAKVVPGAAPPPVLAKPQPPKLPFSYMGQVMTAGREKVVLMQGEQIHLVEKGGQFGGAYQLENVSDDRLTITFLPLGVQQILPIEGAK